LNPANDSSRKPDYKEYAEESDQTIFPILKNKLRLKSELSVMSIYINYVSIRLITGNNQPVSLPENIELVLTQVVRNGPDVDSKDDSDSEDKL
jgi:hypothetical protein